MADWEERYRQGERLADEPHPLVTRFARALAPGRALDVACGAGRHALWLAERAWEVTAVDNAPTAIQILEKRAGEKSVQVRCIVADLERHQFAIEPESYDLIVVCNYLQRDLFASIRTGTRVGGVVIAVIAMVDDNPDVKPVNPAFLLQPGELRNEFPGWEPIHDCERQSQSGAHARMTAELVVRRIA
jgi:SAM-dependent methyltransferase